MQNTINETITREGVAYYTEVTSYNDFIENGQRFEVSLYTPSGAWLEATEDYKTLKGARKKAAQCLSAIAYRAKHPVG